MNVIHSATFHDAIEQAIPRSSYFARQNLKRERVCTPRTSKAILLDRVRFHSNRHRARSAYSAGRLESRLIDVRPLLHSLMVLFSLSFGLVQSGKITSSKLELSTQKFELPNGLIER